MRLARPALGEGAALSEGRELAYVESLGIRNPVTSRGSGTIVGVFVDDGQPVDYGHPLFAIRAGVDAVKKLLIANRGEIAVRVNRAAHEMGLPTVAIFSEADRGALFVRAADEAFCVGPGPAARSYLNVPNIISAALISGADAVHPGYGFLAENARFAEICADHGLTFVGPSPTVIAQMGDKATAKKVMQKAGALTTPGSDVLPSVGEARTAAQRVGYPVLLKATAGGGGKGMRAVHGESDLERAFATAQAEAEANFKDGRLYLEKLLEAPRHVEVQVLGDADGNVVHVGERDCSVQKPSHQKLIEESPAPNLSERMPAEIARDGGRAARAVGYTGAGTLEFLVAGDDVYFMEMNTRIQVEHPVTEMLYGVDLVQEQLRVASGERLSWRQRDLLAHGHVIECRINAEDAANANFAPGGRHAHRGGDARRPWGARRYVGGERPRDPAVLRFAAGQDRRPRRHARRRDHPHALRAR